MAAAALGATVAAATAIPETRPDRLPRRGRSAGARCMVYGVCMVCCMSYAVCVLSPCMPHLALATSRTRHCIVRVAAAQARTLGMWETVSRTHSQAHWHAILVRVAKSVMRTAPPICSSEDAESCAPTLALMDSCCCHPLGIDVARTSTRPPALYQIMPFLPWHVAPL